jgi:3',5'-cyclic AMP phosphodiesterase CpdA
VPGQPALAATLVGLCSAQGIQPATLTTNPRHLSVIGLVRAEQWARARAHFAAAPAGDARVLVLHHNLRRGRLSNRWGLRHGPESLRAFAASGAHVACCGHDHEEQLAQLTPDEAGPGARRPLVACAGTISNRSRGGRPSSINMLTVTAQAITATVRAWDGRTFVAGPALTVPRDG